MDLLEALLFYVLESVRFIPPPGENVEGYLTTDAVRKIVLWEGFLQLDDEGFSDLVFLEGRCVSGGCHILS